MSHMFIYFSDRMTEILKKEADVKESEITSTVVDKCFNISEDDIKLENREIKGNLDKFTILKAQKRFVFLDWGGGVQCLHSDDKIFKTFTKP